jgi:multiple sugar transport system permease protein
MAVKASTSDFNVSSLPRRQPQSRLRQFSIPYLFLLPFGLFFVVFFVIPIFYAIYQSLFRSQRSGLGLGLPTVSFNGIGNYLDVVRDQNFISGLGRMLLFGIVQVPIMLGLALLLALLLDSSSARWKGLFRTAFFIPYAIPGVVAALVWGYLYTPQLSPFVQFARGIGFTGFDLLAASTVLWSIANITTWTWTGYNMLIIIAALQAIPTEVYEAAKMDGCTGFNIARYIKIPMVAPALILTCVFSIIGTLQLFTEPLVLSSISNNVTSAYTPNYYAYYTAFSNNNYYYTAALSVVLALVSFVFSFGFLRITQRYSGV